ncbi:MAG: AMP-binding protein, partial [Gammaproteobacteria bacterium]
MTGNRSATPADNSANSAAEARYCLHQRIEDQAAAQPDAIAVSYGEQKLSYAELNQRANQLANKLVAAGVTPDTTVGLCLERSVDLLVGLVGILKAGGAYVPLDPAY